MIQKIKFKSALLQTEAELELAPGLNVFTGETGTGKSLLLEGISFALGKTPARFSQRDASIALFFDTEEASSIRREVSSKKSLFYIEEKEAKASEVRALGEERLLIQSQGAARNLLQESFHLPLLDLFLPLETQKKLTELQARYKLWQEKAKLYQTLQEEAEKTEREKEFLEFQYQEIASLALTEGEDEELKAKLSRLEHQEQIQEAFREAYAQLYSSDGAAIERLAGAQKSIEKIAAVSPEAQALLPQLESLSSQCSEAIALLSPLVHQELLEKQEIEALQERYYRIQELKRKYKKSLPEIIRWQEELARKLQFVEKQETVLEEARKEEKKAQASFLVLAQEVSRKRQKAAQELERKILSHLSDLRLSQAQFKVAFTKDSPGEKGIDKIAFFFSSSPSLPLAPLSKIASGGELSRVFLALVTSFAERKKIPTLILDEVDTGIGGETALSLGKKLAQLSSSVQILLVTHQPALAAFACAHFRVDRAGNQVTVKKLGEQEKLLELSRMLRGTKRTQPAQNLARELLETAKSYKSSLKKKEAHSF